MKECLENDQRNGEVLSSDETLRARFRLTRQELYVHMIVGLEVGQA